VDAEPVTPTDPFEGGQLPSEFPEVQALAATQRLLREQVDMQFADMRALLRLPHEDVAPQVGCNTTLAAMVFNQISGFSVWFFHNPAAQRIKTREVREKRRVPLSGQRFKGFVRAYYPRRAGEPRVGTIADKLYEARNVLAHNLGVEDLRTGRRRAIVLKKPDPPLAPEDVVDLELQPYFPLAGLPVQRVGLETTFYLPGLYWATGRMLRAALADQADRCEQRAKELLRALPVPATTG
jgi:hypothetical protein